MGRILVIDDVARVREALTKLIRQNGHSVQGAADGVEGLALHRAKPFDVVVADIVMPHKDGIETILELRAETPKVGIIAISGGTGMRDTEVLGQLEVL